MTIVLIVVAVVLWLAFLAGVWALCVAAARSDRAGRGAVTAPLRAVPEAPSDTLVADTGQLRRSLEAIAELLDASGAAIEVRSASGTDELAAVPESGWRGAQVLATPVPGARAPAVELVVHRRFEQPPFDAEDRALLEKMAAGLTRNGPLMAQRRSSRFARNRNKAATS